MASLPPRPLGASGLLVSAVGLGCNNLGRPGTASESVEGSRELVAAAIDAGVTLFDTADVYGGTPGQSEAILGEVLGTARRDRVVLATKFGHQQLHAGIDGPAARASRRYVRMAVEASLTRLRTDWIDLYQLHTPDPVTPIEETLAALDELIAEGKVRYIGHSNFAGWQIVQADAAAVLRGHERFISAQDEYSLLERGVEREVLPAARSVGAGFLPYFPLANGLLTGKFRRDGSGPADSRVLRQRPHLLEQAPWDAIEAFERFCEERGISMLSGAIGWLLATPGLTSVIAGATRPEQVVANVAAAEWQPTPAERAEIDALFDSPS